MNAIFVSLISLFILMGCSSDTKTIHGIWQIKEGKEKITIVFLPDNTWMYVVADSDETTFSKSGKYGLNDGSIKMTFPEGKALSDKKASPEKREYKLLENGKSLVLDGTTYKRLK